MGKFGQILINVMILDLFDYKYNSFIDFAKVEKKFWKFSKTLGKFSKKMPDIKLQILKITENVLINMHQNINYWGYQTPKIPPIRLALILLNT